MRWATLGRATTVGVGGASCFKLLLGGYYCGDYCGGLRVLQAVLSETTMPAGDGTFQ